MYIHNYTGTIIAKFLALLIIVLSGANAHAQTPDTLSPDASLRIFTTSTYLAQNDEAINKTVVAPSESRPSAEIVVQPVTNDKNCMMVCARWGEDCTYTDRGIAGTNRSCRRTCQQFSEECF